MAFTIPNEADAFVLAQAGPDSVDFGILAAGYARDGVTSGCAVTAQGTPDMTVAVASGVVIVAGVPGTVTSGNVTITAAHASYPRFDLIVANSSGTKSAVAGTAASNAVFPAIPATSVVLAAVYVAAAVTTIVSNRITDKRISIVNVFTSPTIVTPTIAATDWTNATHTHAGATTGGQVGAGNLSGATLAAGVTASSLTSLGTLTGLTVNSATITLSQDTNFVLSGGVNGVSFDGTTFSVDGTNNRVGVGTAAPSYQFHNYHVPVNNSGEVIGAQFTTVPSPSGTSTGVYNAMQAEIGLDDVVVDISAATIRGARFTAYMDSDGQTVASSLGMLCSGNNYAGTTTKSSGLQLGHTVIEGSIVTAVGLQVNSTTFSGAGTVTNQIGISMPSMTGATNNTNVLIGTITAVAGTFSIYNVSTYANYFAGLLWIGDTANANMTLGLTVNQGSADNQIVALKSSDVAHALTSGGSVNAETDDYVSIQKFSATLGGLLLASFQEDPAGAQVAMAIDAFGGQAATGPSTTNENLFIIRAAEHNAANALVNAPANSQIFGVQRRVAGAWNNAFVVDAEGDLFVDGNIVPTAFDEWDDVALVRAFDQSRSARLIRSRWDDYVHYNQVDLQRAGIISTPTDAGRAMVNVTQLQRLHNGAIWQLGTKVMSHEERIEYLEEDNKVLRQELLALTKGN